jgi:tetratricopeptide (TPR) repeat protein
VLLSCEAQNKTTPSKKEQIIEKYLKNGAWRYDMFSREWQEQIDEGLRQDSTVAYLWQQKAMPLFKQQKYELGMKYLDKAVLLEPVRWLDYRGFIKCIFAKNYSAAIADFNECLKRQNSYVMDHSYNFYIALSLLQLNEFEKGEKILIAETEMIRKTKGEEWVHHLDLFYLGIAKYEQKKYSESVLAFDRALKLYPNFSDAKYFKALALGQSGQLEAKALLIKEAKIDFDKGYTINEDNALYEKYPYQVNWKMVKVN